MSATKIVPDEDEIRRCHQWGRDFAKRIEKEGVILWQNIVAQCVNISMTRKPVTLIMG